MAAPQPVNRWVEADWAKRYLADRDGLPHRMEGFAVLLGYAAALTLIGRFTTLRRDIG